MDSEPYLDMPELDIFVHMDVVADIDRHGQWTLPGHAWVGHICPPRGGGGAGLAGEAADGVAAGGAADAPARRRRV